MFSVISRHDSPFPLLSQGAAPGLSKHVKFLLIFCNTEYIMLQHAVFYFTYNYTTFYQHMGIELALGFEDDCSTH